MLDASAPTPTPDLYFETINAYQRTAALKAALELGLFTALGDGATAADLAGRLGAAERGTRLLSDFLTVIGFLTKRGDLYQPTPSTAHFLDRNSPGYIGGTMEFLACPDLARNFEVLTETVRNGTVAPSHNTVSEGNPVWVPFARAMRPMMAPVAEAIATVLAVDALRPLKVLDVAAGHGAFGAAIAQRNPEAEVVAVDWAPVLDVAKENAARAGIATRYRTIAGNAFTVDFGHGYQLALLTNFLHHFDEDSNVALLKRVHAALAPEGQVAVLEYVPNADRVSPPGAASFGVMMLAGTPHGDAYTFAEWQDMLESAGFAEVSETPLRPSSQTLVIGWRR
jgi:SAM-dependent methyltransferase